MTSAAAIAPSRSDCSRLLPRALAEQETGGEQVAGAGRVDQFAMGSAETSARSPPRVASAPSSLRVTTSVSTLPSIAATALSRCAIAGERLDLRLVGEQDVDPPAVEQLG